MTGRPDKFGGSAASRALRIWILVLVTMTCQQVVAQDLEPRRWSHLPTGINVIGVGMGFTQGDILFDPVLEIEEAEMELATTAFVYLRTLDFLGRSARLDVLVPYASGRWSGLLQGEPASTRRRGFADPRLRFSVLLYGGEALAPAEFAQATRSNTVVGAAVSLSAPLGDYRSDRLINLSRNRWIIRPQIGVTHTRGKWTFELTGSAFLYDDNDDFFNGETLENDPLYAIQGHLIYSFRPGLWVSLSSAYGDGANAALNGQTRDARTEKWLSALSVGLPIDSAQGIKISWVREETQNNTGANLDSLVLGWSRVF